MLRYTVHPHALSRPGMAKAVPLLSSPIIGEALGFGVVSDVIEGPAEVRLCPAADAMLAIANAVGDAPNPAITPLVIYAGGETWFELPAGRWRLAAVAA